LRLAELIEKHDLLQPIGIRPLGEYEYEYEIVAGERRWRAAKLSGHRTITATKVEVDEQEALALSLLENLQREDLNPFEETLGILSLLAMTLEASVDEVVALLQRMWNEAQGKITHNVMGNEKAIIIERTFEQLGRMSWQSFV